MPTCRDVSERATDYMERAMTLRENLAMRLHLGLCGACRAYLGQLRMTATLLRNRPLGAPPDGLGAQLAERARQLPTNRDTESSDTP